MKLASKGCCPCSAMSSLATDQPMSSTVPMSASTASRTAASAAGAGAAWKEKLALALPVASVTEYLYQAPGARPVMVAAKSVPLQPRPAV